MNETGEIKKLKKRLDSHIEKRGPDECWSWKGKINRFGTGAAYYRCNDLLAHRLVAWVYGILPRLYDSDFVIRLCGNKLCCNPAHMILGGYEDRSLVQVFRGLGMTPEEMRKKLEQ